MKTRLELLFCLFLLGVGGVFYFTRLDNWFLWQDEANAALLAKNILRDGLPTVYDGRNLIWPNQWDVSPTRHVWILWGWLPLYINALIFWLLGVSTLTARLAPALFAWLALPLAYMAMRRAALPRGAAETAACLILFCVPFTILMRQCGYYAYAIYFSFGLFASYFLMDDGRKRSVLFLIFSLLLANSHLLTWGMTLGALVLADLWDLGHLRRNTPLFCLAVLAALPFLGLYETWTLFNRSFRGSDVPPLDAWGRTLYYARYFHECVLRGELAAVLGLCAVMVRTRMPQKDKVLLLKAATFVAAGLALTAVASKFFFFRYVTFTLPIFFLAASLILLTLWNLKRWLGVCLLILTAAYVGLGINGTPAGRPSFLLNFFREISADHTDLNEVLAGYLMRNAKPTDVVVCNYENFPLQFYAPCLVRGGPGRVGLYPEKSYPELGIGLVEKPDYIVFRRHWPTLGGDKIRDWLQTGDYEPVFLPGEDTVFGNREDPHHHYYETPKFNQPFPLFQLKRKPA